MPDHDSDRSSVILLPAILLYITDTNTWVMMASSSLSIFERCHAIKQSLFDLESAPDADVSRRTSDLKARFELWAGNLGAFHQPTQRLSLDARLANSPDIRDEIARHLQDITEAAIELKTGPEAIPPGEVHYSQTDRDSPVDECGVLIEVISQSLAFLFRLAVLVKAPGSESRWNRAMQRTGPFPDHFDYDHVLSKYPYMETDSGRQLAKRVAQANVKRRQFIKYCRDHTAHLSTEKRPSNDGVTEHVSSKATTLPPGMDLNTLAAEEFDDDVDSLMTASTTFDNETKLRLPLLNTLSTQGEAFQCPICHTLKQFDREKSWKKHAYQDLRAYICTIGGRDCVSEMFGDRKSWDKSATMAHIKVSHGLRLSDQLATLADSGRTVPNHFQASDCPFCDWPLERRIRKSASSDVRDEKVSRAELKRHIAMHLEQLALFVLPLADAVDDDDEEEDREDDEEEPYRIKCICGFPDDDGNTIYCETCDTWQHIECFYPDNIEDAYREDFSHSCADCTPRPLNRQRAHELQRQRRTQAEPGRSSERPPSLKGLAGTSTTTPIEPGFTKAAVQIEGDIVKSLVAADTDEDGGLTF
ncbi:hypothetical protein PG993_012571, partial [Apiospora rasikravindrae]